MKFRNQTRYAGHTISNVLNKPLMRKKGKQWIVVSLSALMLLGLGGVAASTTHAAAVPNSRAQTMAVKSGMNSALAKSASAPASATSSKASSASAKPSDVEAQAKQMKAGLMKTAMVHQPMNAGRINSVRSAKSGSAKPVSAKSANDNGMQALNLGNGLQQAKRWNFVQHGINNTDFVPTNVSGSKRVNSKASGNQTTPASSASAKASVAPSSVDTKANAPINARKPLNSAMQSYEDQMSGTDARVASANAVNAGSNSNGNEHKALLKDNANIVTNFLHFDDENNNGTEISSAAVAGSQGATSISDNGSNVSLASYINDVVPSGYSIANPQSNPSSLSGDDQIDIVNVVANKQNDNIDVKPNEAIVTGTINLKFTNSQGTITTVPLQYGFQASDDADPVNVLQKTNYFDNVTSPSGYSSNHDIFRLDNGQPINADDFTYQGGSATVTSNTNKPYNFQVTKSDATYANGSQHHIFDNITLNFKANDNANSDKEAINYVDPDGNVIGSRSVQASDGTQLPTNNNTQQGTIGGNTPKGYTINGDNPANVIMHKGGNQIIHVTPTNDTPADITGATVENPKSQSNPNGSTTPYDKTKDKNGHQNSYKPTNTDGTTPTQLAKNGAVPKGYHVDSNNPVSPVTDQNGHQVTDGNGKPEYKVNLQPNNEHMVVRYYYENDGKQIFVGDDHFTGAYNSSDTVTNSNDKGLDSGYQLINGNPANTFKFGSDRSDNNIVSVPVSVKTTTENNVPIVVNTDNGKSGNGTLVPVNKEGQPITGGHAQNGDNNPVAVNGNGQPVNKEGQPITGGTAKNGDNTPATANISGQDGHKMTPSDLNKSGQLPKGFHATTSVTPGAVDKNGQPIKASVTVAPNTEHEFVQYYYTDANGNKIQVGNTIMKGQYGKSDTVTASNDKGLDSGYQLTGKSDTFTFQSDRDDNNMVSIPVKPQAFSNKDTVTFKDINGKTIGQGTVPADSTPSDAGKNIEGNGSNHNDKNQVPNGYHIINSDQTINPSNGSHTVLVAPNAGTPAVMSYKKPGDQNATPIIGKDGKPLNGVNGQKVTPSDLDNSGLLPNGYHATNGATYGNNGANGTTPQIINIAPNEEHEIVRYYLEDKGGQKVFVGDDYFTGMNGASSTVTSDTAKGLNSGYHLIKNNPANTFKFTAPSDSEDSNVDDIPVNLTQSNSSDSVQFVDLDNNNKVINDNSGAKSFSVGKQAPSDMIADSTIQNEVPTGYHMVDPNEAIHYNGATHDVAIAPDTESENISFDNSGKPMSSTATGNYGQQGNANTYVPQGYHLKTNPDGTAVTNDGARVSPTFTFGKGNIPDYAIEPNQSADTIIYVDDDNNTNNGNVIKSYTTGGGFANQPLSGNDVVAPKPANNSTDTYNNVPAGYQIDPASNNRTDLTYDGLTHVIYVNGVKQQPQNVTVNIIAKDNNGKAITGHGQKNGIYDSFSVQESGIIGDTYTINPTDGDVMDHVPAGSAPVPSDEPATGEITTKGLTNKTIYFTYDAPAQSSNDIMVYYRTNDGKTINSGVIDTSKAAINSTGDVTQKVQVPKGYAVDSGENTQYKVTSKPQYLSFTVHGLPAKDVFNSDSIPDPNQKGITPQEKQKREDEKQAIEDKTKISIIYVYRNQQNSFSRTYQEKFNLDNSTIGSTMLIYPASGIQGTSTPQGYTEDPTDKIITSTLTPNGATPGQITYIYNAQNRAVNFNFNVKNSKGQAKTIPGSNQTVNGNTGSDITNNINVPEGYHLVPGEHVHVPENNNTRTTVNVQLQGDHVVGQAKLDLLYQRGNHISDEVKILPISGSIGDSDITIDPQSFNKPGYEVATTGDWKIPFDIDGVKNTDNGDTFRDTPTQTFIYKATPITINVDYVDTQTGKPVAGIKSQVISNAAYDGDTIDLQDANASNNDGQNNNGAAISIDGHDYSLNIPAGYHLAHANNYIKVAQNATGNVSVTDPFTGHSVLRMMPLMKLTLGIMPHFHKHNTQPAKKPAKKPAKPASQGNVTPAKSASASSVAPSSATAPASSASTPYIPDDNFYINNTSNSSYITNNYNYSSASASSSAKATSAGVKDDSVDYEPVQPAKASAKTVHSFKAVQNMPVGATVRYHGMNIQRVGQKEQNLFYFYVIKPCYVHSKMNFAKHTFVRYLPARHGYTLPIQRIFKVNGRTRFEVRWGHHLYFVTGNSHFTRNAYYQRRDMRRNRRNFRHIRILRGCCEYHVRYFNRFTEVRGLHRGMVLKVRRIVTIGRKHMTRFQLTNGHWVTSNKNFVQLFK